MAQSLAVVERLPGDDLGKRVGGVLVGVGGQGAQRLELTDRRQPARDGRTGARPPALDRIGNMQAPVQEKGERGEELIAPRVEQFEQVAKLGNAFRGSRRVRSGREDGLQFHEPRGRERRLFQPGQHVGQQRQVARPLLHLGQHGLDALEDKRPKNQVEENDSEERQPSPSLQEKQAVKRYQTEHAEDDGHQPRPLDGQDRCGRSPPRHALKIDAGRSFLLLGLPLFFTERLTEERQIFAQIELRAQLGNGTLA